MTKILTNQQVNHQDDESNSKVILGFWIYILTDCVLFASLFATYAVMINNTFGGPTPEQLFNLQYVLTETLILLTSSFTCGLAMLAVNKKEKKQAMTWFLVTFLLGISFLVMEVSEFTHLLQDGNSFTRSGYLSSFFTLVGTHGLHITAGLIWICVMMIQLFKGGFTPTTTRRLTSLSMFWHFLDIVWIFIFSIVYLVAMM